MMDPDGEEVWSDEEMDGAVDGRDDGDNNDDDDDDGLSLSLSAAASESSGLSEEGTCTTGSSGSSSNGSSAGTAVSAIRGGGGGGQKKRRAAAMMAPSGDDGNDNNGDDQEVRAAKRPHRATVDATTEGTCTDQILPPSSDAAKDKKRRSKSKASQSNGNSNSKKSKKKKSKTREKSSRRRSRDVLDAAAAAAPQIDGDGGSSQQLSSSGGSQSSIPSFGHHQAPRRQRSQTSMGSLGGNMSLPGLGRSPSNDAFFRSLPSFSFSDVAGQFGGLGAGGGAGGNGSGGNGGAMSSQAQSTAASLHDLQANLEAALAGYNNNNTGPTTAPNGPLGGSASEAAASLAATAAAAAAANSAGGGGDGGINSAADGLLLHSHSLASLFDTGGSASAAAAAAAASTEAQSQSNLLGGPATAALGTSNSANSLFLASLPGWNTGAGTAPQPVVPMAAAAPAAPPADAAASVSQRKPQAKKTKDKSKSSSDTKAQSKSKKKSSTGSNKKRRQERQQPQQASVSSASGGSSGNAPTKVTESSSSAHESSSSSNEDRAPRAQQVLPAQPPNPPVQHLPQFQQPLPQPANQHNHHHHNQHGQVQQQQQPQQLHPLAMQSTANCPPIQPGLTATPAGFGMLPFLAFNPAGLASMLGSSVPNAGASAAGMQGMASAAPSLVPQNNNASAAMAAAATQGMNPALTVFQQQQRALAAALAQHLQQQQQNASATINPAAAVVPPPPPSNQDRKPAAQRVSAKPSVKKNRKATVASSSGNTSSSSTDIPSASSASAMGGSNTSSSGTTVPPFYLFDAPYELRMNFLQSQRMHDATNTTVGAAAMPASSTLPTPSLTPGDPNSYHYGLAVSGVSVNGFHPQLNAMSNPTLPLSGLNSMGLAAATSASMIPQQQGAGQNQNVRLLDGRSFRPEPAKKVMSKAAIKERNEREQRRAQKIAELIENLRLSMVKGGWKVEMKSKYHTLSTCADYVKHLLELTKAKETAIEQAKSDLEEKKQERRESKKRAAEEAEEGANDDGGLKAKANNIPPASDADANAIMQDSDPESETSSLTAFSSGEGADDGKEEGVRHSKKILAASSSSDDIGRDGGKKTASTNTGKRKHGSTSDPLSSQKKVRLPTSGNKSSSAADDSLSSDESGPGGKNISLDKMSSSVSEMTDSNQSSSMVDIDTGVHDADRSMSSISSTAAVGPPRGGSREKTHRHADVVIKERQTERKGRKRKVADGKEKTSLDEDFELDYSEVFHTANVPQLIATPAGKVVTWNDFFLRATGLSGEEAKRLSIFSIVQADKLSTLFELVANALKNGASKKKRKRGRKKPRPSSSSGSGSAAINNRPECNSIAGSAAASATTGSSGTGSETSTASSNKPVDYSAVTLPCVSFQATYPRTSVAVEKKKDCDPTGANNKDAADGQAIAGPKKVEKAKAEANLNIPLYMTVTLMSDNDPRKRCFHCVLTDTPATSSGKIGVVTPELLAMLFTEDDDEDENGEGNGSSPTNNTSNNTGGQTSAFERNSKPSDITMESDANVESEQKNAT